MISQRDRQAWDRFLAAGWKRGTPAGPGRYVLGRSNCLGTSALYHQDIAEIDTAGGVYVGGRFECQIQGDGTPDRGLYPPLEKWWWWGPIPTLPDPPEPDEAPDAGREE